jgi:enamine deaminase RidA (YjgF/YER057c/UK114 family)
MSLAEEQLKRSGIVLPQIPVPSGLYLPALRAGDFVYTSGQLPLVEGRLLEPGGKGKINELNQEHAVLAARIAALNALAAIRSVVSSLDDIKRIVRLTVYVASEPYFTNQHIVANGASFLLGETFGELGRHVRSAVGVAELPLDASVEVELVAFCPAS